MESTYIYFFIIGMTTLLYLVKNIFGRYFRVTTMINPHLFYKNVKKGYGTLVSSLYHDSNKKVLFYDIQNMLAQRTDGRYFGGYTVTANEFNSISFSLDLFYDVLRHTEEEIHFVLDLDKNLNLKKFNNFFENSLHTLEDKSFIITHNETFSFPYENVLPKYQKELNKHSIQIGFFSDGSDSHYLILFPSTKEKLIKKAISNIGFKYKRTLGNQESVLNELIVKTTYKTKQKMAFV